MADSQDDSEWEKSTSEIQSEDSEDLFAARPNRWRGPPQSWRTLTEEDRLTFNALERLRNQDLSVHLYNAFSLRTTPISHTHHQPVDADSQPPQGSPPEPWAPPKSWTAWPLRADLVPPDDFMKRTEDEDEASTFRKSESTMPSKHLEEVVSAAILRSAKEKFRKRQLDESLAPAHDRKVAGSEPVSSANESTSNEAESEEGKEKALDARFETARVNAGETTYQPVVATDDDVSYKLIRPSARAILSKIDHTLTILHIARATNSRGVIESTCSSSDEEDDLYNEATPSGRRSRSRTKSRSRSRTKSRSRPTSSPSSLHSRSRSVSRDAIASPSKPKSNRGRKATSVPREGESERDFLRRRAKAQKKRQPLFSDDETTTAAEGVQSPRKSRRRPARARGEDGESWMRKKLERFNLRDWSDIMGAAALAGFDARVIERATQRCANLFGQGMEMHTIDDDARVETKRYVPGRVVLWSDSEEEEEAEEQAHDHQKRSLSLQSSLAPSRAISLASSDDLRDEQDEGCHQNESPRKRQKRSMSRGSLMESYYCHHAGCERAIRSFDRPANLRRHLKLVHGEGDGQEGDTPQSGHSPGNNLYYCTHVDCERATRPFEKGHNLRRHLQRVHGEGIGGSSKAHAAGDENPSTPAAIQLFCPHAGCDRAMRAFDRRPNLKRHLKLVHGDGELRGQKQSLRTDHDQTSTERATREDTWHSEPPDVVEDYYPGDESSAESASDSEGQ